MLFQPHENEIDFNPEVRSAQMAAEERYRQAQHPVFDYSNKGSHDRFLARAKTAKTWRNVEAGGFAALLSERLLDLNLTPNGNLGALAVGSAPGILCGRISQNNRLAKNHIETATLYAAYEVEAAKFEGEEAPDWALYALQEAHTTAQEVLRPPTHSN